jgi:hypothetical protein
VFHAAVRESNAWHSDGGREVMKGKCARSVGLIAVASIAVTFAASRLAGAEGPVANDSPAQPASAPTKLPAKTAKSTDELIAELADLDPATRIRATRA